MQYAIDSPEMLTSMRLLEPFGIRGHNAKLSDSAVEVKRVPTFSEVGTPVAYYEPPAMDGSRPRAFFANLKDVKEIPKYSMRTLAYHEAIPGHHLQLAIAQEIPDLPIFRSVLPFTAYMEGWALYAEQLAWETGY